jgi:hypothetical protein
LHVFPQENTQKRAELWKNEVEGKKENKRKQKKKLFFLLFFGFSFDKLKLFLFF